MKTFRIFSSENFHFLVVKFSVYLNRHVLVMLLVGNDKRVYQFPFVKSRNYKFVVCSIKLVERSKYVSRSMRKMHIQIHTTHAQSLTRAFALH